MLRSAPWWYGSRLAWKAIFHGKDKLAPGHVGIVVAFVMSCNYYGGICSVLLYFSIVRIDPLWKSCGGLVFVCVSSSLLWSSMMKFDNVKWQLPSHPHPNYSKRDCKIVLRRTEPRENQKHLNLFKDTYASIRKDPIEDGWHSCLKWDFDTNARRVSNLGMPSQWRKVTTRTSIS
jgi:hypothetical protein